MATAILTSKIDSDRALSKYFLPYQLDQIRDISACVRKRITSKSVRIGYTFGDGFANVRKRLLFKNRDYLFVTKDWPTALEYVQHCARMAQIFGVAKAILTQGEETVKVTKFEGDRATSVTEEVRTGFIKFDTGSRILAFTSNPNAVRAYGGDVGWDEVDYALNQEETWAAMQGRIRWGGDIGIWSSHSTDDTLFWQFCREAEKGIGGWKYSKITIFDAVEQGLVEKVNQVSGQNKTREQFIAECREDARLEEIFERDYNCNPKGGASVIVPWGAIQKCAEDYKIERVHLEAKQIVDLFGEFTPETQAERERRIVAFIRSAFAKLFQTPGRYRLGFDVAASGQGDLAVIYVDGKRGGELVLRGLFTCRTDDWDFLKIALWTFLRWLSAVQGAGDETGLGRQICWETAMEFPGQFLKVNFSGEKHKMGLALMNQLGTAEKRFPKNENEDVANDYFAMRKTFAAGRWVFSEGRNALNPNSHCDIAWAGALSSKADEEEARPYAHVVET
jgi:phage FluMu gp28-like protein